MPPKAEITKEKVLDAAFELVRKSGLEILTARSIAQELKCSTQPIYSMYGSMEPVKNDVFTRAVDFAFTSMKQYENETNAPAMNLAIGCLLFAQNEKQLFKALFLSEYSSQYLKRNKDKIYEDMYSAFIQLDNRLNKIAENKIRKIFLKLSVYWLGIGTMISTNIAELDINEAISMLEEMYKSLTIKEGLN